jgi:hypothetical protein
MAAKRAIKGGNKYGAEKLEHAGRTFDSGGEARCFDYLKLLERAGEIKFIQAQFTVELAAGIKYRADFLIYDSELDENVLVEYKGFENETWLLKKKLYRVFGVMRLRIYTSRRDGTMLLTEEINPRALAFEKKHGPYKSNLGVK